MKRHRLVALVAALCIFAALAAPVSAGKRWVEEPPPVTLDNGGDCQTSISSGDWSWNGHTNSASATSRSGVAADYVGRDGTDTGFKGCQQTAIDIDHNGVFMFLTLYPRNAVFGTPGCSAGPQSNCSIRFGVAECWGTEPFCDGVNTPRYYMTAKGCDGTPDHRDLGPAGQVGPTNMYFYLNTSGNFVFFANGVHETTIGLSDLDISCWANTILGAGWFWVQWDYGDSLGTVSTAATYFGDVKYGLYNAGWFNPGWGTGDCWAQEDAYCHRFGGNDMYVYTP